jgi:hypothetical protein
MVSLRLKMMEETAASGLGAGGWDGRWKKYSRDRDFYTRTTVT